MAYLPTDVKAEQPSPKLAPRREASHWIGFQLWFNTYRYVGSPHPHLFFCFAHYSFLQTAFYTSRVDQHHWYPVGCNWKKGPPSRVLYPRKYACGHLDAQ